MFPIQLTQVAKVVRKLHSTAKLARSRQNVKIAQKLCYADRSFCWVYSNTLGIHCKHMASHCHVEVRTLPAIIDIITISFTLHLERTDCTSTPQRTCQVHCGRFVVII